MLSKFEQTEEELKSEELPTELGRPSLTAPSFSSYEALMSQRVSQSALTENPSIFDQPADDVAEDLPQKTVADLSFEDIGLNMTRTVMDVFDQIGVTSLSHWYRPSEDVAFKVVCMPRDGSRAFS